MKKFRQTGSQIIEFALVLPIIILILLLVVEAGILTFNKAIITNASREAARRGVMLTAAAWDAVGIAQGACDAVRDALVTFSSEKPNSTCAGDAGPAITVTPSAVPEFGARITVTIAFPMTGVFLRTASQLGYADPNGDPVSVLTASTSMAHE